MESGTETQTKERECLAEYEKTLVFPPQPKRRLFVLCPVGLVGSGKSTLVKILAEKLSLVCVSGDDFRKILHDHGLGYASVQELLPEITRKYILQGYSVAIDSDCASPRNSTGVAELEKEFEQD